MSLTFRDRVCEPDVAFVTEIVTSTGFFAPDEIITAADLVKENLLKGEELSGYSFLFAELDGKTIGYTCYGRVMGSPCNYNLYWIAVHKDFQHQAIGKQILAQTENAIRTKQGWRVYVETSGSTAYLPTREFYRKNSYRIEATLEDYFHPGESKVILIKDLQSTSQTDETKASIDSRAIAAGYSKSWLLLKRYDDASLLSPRGTAPIFPLSADAAEKAISELRQYLESTGEVGEFFGQEREPKTAGLRAILGNIEQTFGHTAIYPSLENKAAHLLYFVIKDHPFIDGNKRIASFLFVWYLDQNKRLRRSQRELVVQDTTLVSLALLVAQSDPREKERLLLLIENCIAFDEGKADGEPQGS